MVLLKEENVTKEQGHQKCKFTTEQPTDIISLKLQFSFEADILLSHASARTLYREVLR